MKRKKGNKLVLHSRNRARTSRSAWFILMRGGHEPRWPETHKIEEKRPRDFRWAYENKLLKSCSVAKLCPTLCERMDRSMPGSFVPSLSPGACPNSCSLSLWCHPTVSSSVAPSPPALNPSQHQGVFQWVGSPYQVAKVLELQLKSTLTQFLLLK